MWQATCHRWNSRAAFLAACDAAGWSRGPDGQPIPGEGIVLDVIGPAVAPPTMEDGVIIPGAVDPRWHVNVARIGVDLPAGFAAATITPPAPLRAFGLPPPPAPAPAPVPDTIPAWKGRAILREAGRMPAVQAAVAAAGGRVADAWAGAAVWRRDSPFLATLAAAIGLSAAQVDQLFRDADTIRG